MCNVREFLTVQTRGLADPMDHAQKINYKGIVPLYIVFVKFVYSIYRYSIDYYLKPFFG
jgi:hypothetical protein